MNAYAITASGWNGDFWMEMLLNYVRIALFKTNTTNTELVGFSISSLGKYQDFRDYISSCVLDAWFYTALTLNFKKGGMGV